MTKNTIFKAQLINSSLTSSNSGRSITKPSGKSFKYGAA